ncbi:MAG: GTPase HflX [Tepidisphaeraceae bacterium]
MSELKRTELSVRQEQAILVGVILPKSTADPRDPLGELASLAKTAGARVVGTILQRRQRVDAGTYVGSGKVKEIAALAIKERADVVIFDNDLSPGQIGALEKIINEEADSPPTEGIKVLDRSELILDIFATRAQTHEAKLQVELAQMQYTYPRLTRMWGHLERIAGGAPAGIGTRGPGEQQLEIDRRLVRKRISRLQGEIEKIQQRKTRLVAERTRQHFTICIVGYTNAGKSTLFNTLTAAGAYADDKLFATLDTKTRAWKLDRGLQVLLSDTVGFVRDLPHNLVTSAIPTPASSLIRCISSSMKSASRASPNCFCSTRSTPPRATRISPNGAPCTPMPSPSAPRPAKESTASTPPPRPTSMPSRFRPSWKPTLPTASCWPSSRPTARFATANMTATGSSFTPR